MQELEYSIEPRRGRRDLQSGHRRSACCKKEMAAWKDRI